MPELKEIVADHILTLPPYPKGREWQEGENLVRLCANENPLGPSLRAIEAIRRAAAKIHRYPDGQGWLLKERLAQQWSITPQEIILGNGSNEVFELAVRTFVQKGEEVLLPTPTFAYYRIIAQAHGAVPVLIPLEGFRIDLARIGERVGGKTRLIFLSNPNNPTGTIFTTAELEAFLTPLPKDVIVVMDEAYGEYVTSPDYPTLKEYQSLHPWTITTRTFSKFYGLAGLRIGYGITRPELIGEMEKVRQPFSVNYLAQVAARAALEDKAHKARTSETNEQGKRYLYEGFSRLGLAFVATEANFILVHLGPHTAAAIESLLRDGVVVRGMAGYGLDEYIRVSIGLPEENRRLIEALQRWKKGS